MDSHARVLVVGGGIFGTAAADALARGGASHVQLVERGHLGAGATAYAAGLLSLHTALDAEAELIQRTRDLLVELVAWGRERDEAAARTAWTPSGGLTVAARDQRAHLEDLHVRHRRLGVDADLMGGPEAARAWPMFRFAPDETVLPGPLDGYVETTDLVALLRRRAREHGVRIRENRPVGAVVVRNGRVEGVTFEDGTQERADGVLVAGGAWTPRLVEAAGLRLAAAAYRTQVATLEFPLVDGWPVLHDAAHHFYARPESSTRILAGDGTQLRRFDPDAFQRTADQAFAEHIARGLLARLARGEEARYRSGWAGLCVATPDRRPLVGGLGGVEGLYVLTGDNGFGVMRSLALGELAAAALAGRTDDRLEALRPDRFGAEPPLEFPIQEGFAFPPSLTASRRA